MEIGRFLHIGPYKLSSDLIPKVVREIGRAALRSKA
jgi:hypothetical protein